MKNYIFFSVKESKSPLEHLNILHFSSLKLFKQMENDLNCFQHFWFLRIMWWNYERCACVFIVLFCFILIFFLLEDIWGRLWVLLIKFLCLFFHKHSHKRVKPVSLHDFLQKNVKSIDCMCYITFVIKWNLYVTEPIILGNV